MNYVRQILINEPNIDLRYIYFDVIMIDGNTPALSETGGQPEINISNTGWININISVLQTVGYGRYRSLLSNEAVNQLGIIKSRYIGSNTFECFGETIEVIQNYRKINIFEDSDSPIVNSYVNINEAENYFSSIFNSDSWINASINDKIKSLNTATKDIENLAFSGWKTDPNQTLEFPRNGILNIPREIKEATCEIAIKYIEGYDQELETESLGVSQEVYYPIKTIYDATIVAEARIAGINSEVAWKKLKPFLRDPRLLKVIRSN